MIRRLRSRHRLTFVGLAILLPLGLGLAFASRISVPASPRVPLADPKPVAPDEPPARVMQLKLGRIELVLRAWKADAEGARVLELTPKRDLELPDVLVYWADSETSDELPAKSTLLGSLVGTQSLRFELSSAMHGGRLYLYSLAHQELVLSLELQP